jgi:hypothetical protein
VATGVSVPNATTTATRDPLALAPLQGSDPYLVRGIAALNASPTPGPSSTNRRDLGDPHVATLIELRPHLRDRTSARGRTRRSRIDRNRPPRTPRRAAISAVRYPNQFPSMTDQAPPPRAETSKSDLSIHATCTCTSFALPVMQ